MSINSNFARLSNRGVGIHRHGWFGRRSAQDPSPVHPLFTVQTDESSVHPQTQALVQRTQTSAVQSRSSVEAQRYAPVQGRRRARHSRRVLRPPVLQRQLVEASVQADRVSSVFVVGVRQSSVAAVRVRVPLIRVVGALVSSVVVVRTLVSSVVFVETLVSSVTVVGILISSITVVGSLISSIVVVPKR